MPKGFVELKDPQDGYQFLYPFGWQEINIDGQDVVLKDVIEPLESVSVSLVGGVGRGWPGRGGAEVRSAGVFYGSGGVVQHLLPWR